jgi:broad specificity phosphatase PhoE
MELILVRHGETAWNREGKVQGFSDIELSEVGRQQARQVAASLKDSRIVAIYSSPLLRAHQTARIINEYHGVPIHLEAGLMEMNQGSFEGLSFKELMACEKDFLNRWIADPASVRMPDGESLAELQARAWEVIREIADKGDDVLVVSHSFTISSILCKIENVSLSKFRKLHVDTASKTVVRFGNGAVSLKLLNDRSHLTGDGSPSVS